VPITPITTTNSTPLVAIPPPNFSPLLDNFAFVCLMIQPYIDFQSSVNLSLSSKTIYTKLNHNCAWAVSPKIIVTHFEACDMVATLPSEQHPTDKSWISAPYRIRRFLTRALIKMDPRFIERCEMRFPSLASTNGGLDDEHRDSFVFFAEFIERMTNMTELVLDVSTLIGEYDDQYSPRNYAIFGRNLRSCRKLKKLTIINCHYEERGNSIYSVRFLEAILPALRSMKGQLEEVTIKLGSNTRPAEKKKATLHLFLILLSLDNLKVLDVEFDLFSGSLLDQFLQVAHHMHSKKGGVPSTKVEKVRFICRFRHVKEDQMPLYPRPLKYMASFLSLFDNSNATLKEFRLKVPWHTWDARGVMAQKKIMYEKPNLQTLAIDYDGYEDEGGTSFDYLLHYIQQRETRLDNDIHIKGLCSGDGDGGTDSWNALEAYHSARGEECFLCLRDGWTFYLKGRPINWDAPEESSSEEEEEED
jgi:hypothetical protein